MSDQVHTKREEQRQARQQLCTLSNRLRLNVSQVGNAVGTGTRAESLRNLRQTIASINALAEKLNAKE